MWLELQIADCGGKYFYLGENKYKMGGTNHQHRLVIRKTNALSIWRSEKMVCQQGPGVGGCCVQQADNDSILQGRTQLHTSLRQGLLRACCTSWNIGTLNWHVYHVITAIKAFFSVLKPWRFKRLFCFLRDILQCCWTDWSWVTLLLFD